MIATRLRYLPTQDPLTLDIPMDLSQPTSSGSDDKLSGWEMWGEEGMIHLCELRLEFDGGLMCKSTPFLYCNISHAYRLALYANPLRPIQHSYHNLNKLLLVPFTQNPLEPNRRSHENHKTIFYMVSSHLDFGDCTSIFAIQAYANCFHLCRHFHTKV